MKAVLIIILISTLIITGCDYTPRPQHHYFCKEIGYYKAHSVSDRGYITCYYHDMSGKRVYEIYTVADYNAVMKINSPVVPSS